MGTIVLFQLQGKAGMDLVCVLYEEMTARIIAMPEGRQLPALVSSSPAYGEQVVDRRAFESRTAKSAAATDVS